MILNVEISQQENLLGLFVNSCLRHEKENQLQFQPPYFHSFWCRTFYRYQEPVVTETTFLISEIFQYPWHFFGFPVYRESDATRKKMTWEPKIFEEERTFEEVLAEQNKIVDTVMYDNGHR